MVQLAKNPKARAANSHRKMLLQFDDLKDLLHGFQLYFESVLSVIRRHRPNETQKKAFPSQEPALQFWDHRGSEDPIISVCQRLTLAACSFFAQKELVSSSQEGVLSKQVVIEQDLR
jgi:hypothetical protein